MRLLTSAIATVAAAALALSATAGAEAASYCVTDPDCVSSGGTATTLSAALSAAGSSPAADTIRIGATSLSGDFSYAPGIADAGTLTIRGAGVDQTIVAGAAGANGVATFNLGKDTAGNLTTLSDLTVYAPPTTGSGSSVGILSAGVVERVSVLRGLPITNGYSTGVSLQGPMAVLRDSAVRIDPGGSYTQQGVSTQSPNSGPTTLIENTTVSAGWGIFASRPTAVRRTTVRSTSDALQNCNTTLHVDNTVLRSTAGGTGLEAHSSQCGGNGALTEARHVTIIDDGGYGNGVGCSSNFGAPTTVKLIASIVSGFTDPSEDQFTLSADGTAGSACTIRVSASDADLANQSSAGAGPKVLTDDGGNLNADPLFADAAAGNFHLRAGSPAVDAAGTAAIDPLLEGALDRDGLARITDGDGDGVAARDMGAYESPQIAPPQQPGAPPQQPGASPQDGGATAPTSPSSPAPGRTSPKRCKVPSLRGLTLTRAKKRLRTAGCRVGRVTPRKRHGKLVVRRQSRRAGAKVAIGTRVNLTLGKPVRKTRRH